MAGGSGRFVGALAIAAGLSVAGCQVAQPTPIYVTITPSPTPWVIYVTVTPPPPTPVPPTPTPAPPASTCTGGKTVQAFLVQAAAQLPFDLYCGAFPSGWSASIAAYNIDGMGVHLQYVNDSGGWIDIGEGPGCVGSPAQCSQHQSTLGTASFGGLSGELDLFNSTPTYALYVAPGTAHAYEMAGRGISQADFVSLAAAMVKVPKTAIGAPPQATACTGSAAIQAFFAQAAAREPFDVYCGALPHEWSLSAVQYEDNADLLDAIYENATGGWLEIAEGAFCSKSPADCSPHASELGTASFGGLSGKLDLYDSTPAYAIYVAPGTANAYEIDGKGVSQADFVALAAAMVKVARP